MDTAKQEALSQALRDVADYVDSHPDLPEFTFCLLYRAVYTKDELRSAARAMGPFTKVVNDNYFTLVRQFGPVKIEVAVPREQVCKRTIVWDCPDDLESLLKDPVPGETVEAEHV